MGTAQFNVDKVQVITEKYSDHTAHVVLHVGEYQLNNIRGLIDQELTDGGARVFITWPLEKRSKKYSIYSPEGNLIGQISPETFSKLQEMLGQVEYKPDGEQNEHKIKETI